MIEYRNQNGKRDSRGNTKWEIDVLLEEKLVGEIRHVATGYFYVPKGKRTGGEVYPTLAAVKASLED